MRVKYQALIKTIRSTKLLLLMVVIMVAITPSKYVMADTPYKTFTDAGDGYITESQTAYTPLQSITKIGDLSFKGASDMKITPDGEIYIADTQGKRILVSDLEGNLLRIYGEGLLDTPVGIFVTHQKQLYVADKNAGKIVVFNYEGGVTKEYTRPNHPLYGSDMQFKPQKLAVDVKGIMYIVCEGNTNGIVQISPTEGGMFLGYFGTNQTNISYFNIFRRMILSDEQLAKLPRNLPKTPFNLTIDEKGMIYTVTQGDYLSLRKLNIAGKNMLDPYYDDGLPASVAVGNYENIYVVSEHGYIFEYNKDGSLLFVFGAKDSGRLRIGLFQKVVAIGVDKNNNLYVLDQEKNEIQVFQTTEFTDLVHQALQLYQSGKYTESKVPLSQIMEMNSLFNYANLAMGQAYLWEGSYSDALHYFRLAKDVDGYSNSFWEVRNVWLRNHVVTLIGIVFLFYIVTKVIKYLQVKYKAFQIVIDFYYKSTSAIAIKRIFYMNYYIKHPIDGSYGIKGEDKASYFSSNILLFAFLLVYLFDLYGTGFILKVTQDGNYDVIGDVLKVMVIMLLFTVSSYLISTINDGEGTMKQLYTGFIYSLGPYILLKPMVVVLSNVVTLNEQFLVHFSNFAIYAWVLILIFLTIKEINNYSVKETIGIIFLTLFCALIIVLLLFVLYVLIIQVSDFIQSIYGEVVYRFENL